MSSSGLGLSGGEIFGEETAFEAEVAELTTEQLIARTKNEESNASYYKRTIISLEQEIKEVKIELKDNVEKIKTNVVLPYLVANVVEVSEAVFRVCGIGSVRLKGFPSYVQTSMPDFPSKLITSPSPPPPPAPNKYAQPHFFGPSHPCCFSGEGFGNDEGRPW